MADSNVDYRQFVRELIDASSVAGMRQSELLAESADVDRLASLLAPVWNAPTLDIIDVRANGPRIDARLESSSGRAWLAVLWIDAGPPPALLDASLYERPKEFRASSPGFVVVLNGPSSVGKSALMQAFAEVAETPWACLEEPWIGKLPGKFLAWPATAGPRTEGFLAGLAAAARLGNQLIVSAAGIGQRAFKRALTDIPAVYVGLDAPLEELLRRQVTQPDKFGGLAEESVGIHEGWEYDLRIDTAACSPAEAADRLAAFLADSMKLQ